MNRLLRRLPGQTVTAMIGVAWLLAGLSAGAGLDPGFHAPVAEEPTQFTSADALAQFSAPADTVYRLGPGDELTLEVWGHDELSGKQVVGPDGRITISVAGDVKVGGLTRDGARDTIATRLAPLYPEPIVTLRIDRYTANRVYVLGRVANPGLVMFDAAPSLLEAITRAGGLPVGGVGSDKAVLNRCAVFRGKDQVVWIDLHELLRGNMALDIRLQPADLVYIPDSGDQLVYVLGEVQTAGAVRLARGMTVLDALALAGGPSIDADVGSIRLVRAAEQSSQKVSLHRLMKPAPERNFVLEENDILYVPRRGAARVDYWMSKINPFATLMLLGTALVPALSP